MRHNPGGKILEIVPSPDKRLVWVRVRDSRQEKEHTIYILAGYNVQLGDELWWNGRRVHLTRKDGSGYQLIPRQSYVNDVPRPRQRADSILAISQERDRHDAKWGPGRLVQGGNSHELNLAVAVEEVGEIARELVEKKPGWQERAQTEIIQLGAFCAAWHELGDWK